jgi:hypothetical protein
MRLPWPPPSSIALLLAILSLGCDARSISGQTEPNGSAWVGTPASIRAEVLGAGIRYSLSHRLAFKTDTGERVPVIAQSYDDDGDYLAVTGTAEGSEGSAFLLKGDSREIYGWLVLPDRELAYEYTTSESGEVFAKRVPVTSILPICNDGPAVPSASPAFEPPLGEPAGEPPHVGAYDGSADISKLQSRPGAGKVLFVDFSVLSLAPAELWLAWQGVASAYSAFEVNVTTDSAVYDATPVRNRGKACILDEDGRSTCYVNVFGTSTCCTIYNKGNGNYQGLTTAHELGHMMGLDHDGASGTEYFTGFSAYKWVPLMGDCTPEKSWGNQALYQWSKGEYTGANNREDDLAIITKNLPFREDDIPDSKELMVNGSEVSSVENRGQIANNTDTDTFTFTIGSGGGHAKLLVERIEVSGGGMLDVDAEIQSASGERMARGNDTAARTASLDVDLTAGAYKLIIKGGAEGSPQNGFSNYSSLGYYGISGTITGATAGGTGGAGGAPGTGGAGGRSGTGGSAGGTGGSAGSGGGGTGTGGRSGSGDAGTDTARTDSGPRDGGREAAGDSSPPDTDAGAGSGGSSGGGGGTSAVGGNSGSGGVGTAGSGGTTPTGGNSATGGATSPGGSGGAGTTGSGGSTPTGGNSATGGATSVGGSAGSSVPQAAGGSPGSAGAAATGGSQNIAGQVGATSRNDTGSKTSAPSAGCSCALERTQGRNASGLLGCLAVLLVLRRIRRSPGAGRPRQSRP